MCVCIYIYVNNDNTSGSNSDRTTKVTEVIVIEVKVVEIFISIISTISWSVAKNSRKSPLFFLCWFILIPAELTTNLYDNYAVARLWIRSVALQVLAEVRIAVKILRLSTKFGAVCIRGVFL